MPADFWNISNKIEVIEQWERNYQDREQAFRHDERKAAISAARAVAVAYASISHDMLSRPIYGNENGEIIINIDSYYDQLENNE